jgi:glutamate racemase
VLATEGTVRSGIYADLIRGLRPDAEVQMLACNLLVALAEEGWSEGAESEAVIARYLAMLQPDYDTLVLGCTHFPLLIPALRKLCPPDIRIVDSAAVTALSVAGLLAAQGLLNAQEAKGRTRFLVTDLPERFARLGKCFLGKDMGETVESVSFSPVLHAKNESSFPHSVAPLYSVGGKRS